MDSSAALNGHESDEFEYESTPGTPIEQGSSTQPFYGLERVNGKISLRASIRFSVIFPAFLYFKLDFEH